MAKEVDHATDMQALRARAEKQLRSRKKRNLTQMSADDTSALIHELETHQIELEMQNESLRQTQEELIEMRDQYAELYEFAPIGYLTTDDKGFIVQANLTVTEILKVPRSDLVGKLLSSFMLNQDQDVYYKHRKETLETRERQSSELRFRKRLDGSFWIKMDSVYVQSPDGNCSWIRSVLSDISELTYQKIFEAVPNLMGVTSLEDGTYLEVNDEFTRATGYTREEIVGKTAMGLGIIDNNSYRDKMKMEIKKNGRFRNINTDLRLKDEKRHAGLLSGEVFETGGQQCLLTVWLDITELKQAELALNDYKNSLEVLVKDRTADLEETNRKLNQEIEERRRTEKLLMESKNWLTDISFSMEDWIWAVDKDAKYQYASEKVKEILGYDPEEILGRTPFEFMEEEEARRVKVIFDQIASRKQPVVDLENWNLTKNGERICLLTNGVPILDQDGNLAGYRGVDKDITKRKQLELQLTKAMDRANRANNEKSLFLSRMSHELRTPLNAIIGFAQIQERYFDETTTPDLRMTRDHILKGGKHLLGLIDDVLDLVKIEQNEIDMPLEDIGLGAVVEESFSLIRGQAKINSIALHYESVDFCVKANALRLRQVMVNLLTNAIKYNREGGSVTVRAKKVGHEIEVAVEDTGVGIDLNDQEAVFAPFSRLRYATESEIDGSGIGLALTQFIVEQMNGCIGFDSEPEQGAVFWVRLPEGEVVKNEPSVQIEHPTAITGRTHLVLYIEDNLASRQLLQMTLKQYSGINLLTANNAEEGINIAKKAQPDLIFIDINLPGIDGITALKIMKSDPVLKDTRMIALSADAMPNQIETAMDAGFDHYLTKPIDLDKVINIIEAL